MSIRVVDADGVERVHVGASHWTHSDGALHIRKMMTVVLVARDSSGSEAPPAYETVALYGPGQWRLVEGVKDAPSLPSETAPMPRVKVKRGDDD